MFIVRRKNKSRVVYDFDGERISFDEITSGSHTVFTADVPNMIKREIPIKQLFDTFGQSMVVKAEFSPQQNSCRLLAAVRDRAVYW